MKARSSSTSKGRSSPASAPKAKTPKIKEAAGILKCFQAYDTNGDGTINKEDLQLLLEKLDPKTYGSSVSGKKKMDTLMKTIDKDKNGKIDYDEFVRWMMGAKGEADKENVMQAAEKAGSAAPAADKASSSTPAGKGSSEDQKRIDKMLDDLFVVYDEDEDGMIERMELLDGEEKRLGIDFGPKERKACVAWFKEAGAEGTVSDGMFLSKEKWTAAMITTATKELGPEDGADLAKVADWIWENKAQKLVEGAAAKLKAKQEAEAYAKLSTEEKARLEAEAAAKAAVPPEWPRTVPFKELQQEIALADKWNKNIIVFASDKPEIETFFTYQSVQCLDAKKFVVELFVKKNKTKEEAKKEMRTLLKTSMKVESFCRPCWVRMNNSAFDFMSMVGDDVPADVFNRSKWTPQVAHKQDFFDSGHLLNLEAQPEKWNDFKLIITSTFDLESGKKHLAEKIPHFNDLAVIVIDPASIA